MLCYHGTTEKGLRSILKGTDDKRENPAAWFVSENDGAFYCYPLNKIGGDTLDEKRLMGISQAFYSAQIQAAFGLCSFLYVIEFKIAKEYLEHDYSCENMQNFASFLDVQDLDKIEVLSIYKVNSNQYLAPFVLAPLLQNPNFNTYGLKENLKNVALAIADANIYLDDLFVMDYSELTQKEIESILR